MFAKTYDPKKFEYMYYPLEQRIDGAIPFADIRTQYAFYKIGESEILVLLELLGIDKAVRNKIKPLIKFRNNMIAHACGTPWTRERLN